MVEHHHALEQPVLVRPFITIVTAVTIVLEVAMLDVFLLVTGVGKHPLVTKVSILYQSLQCRLKYNIMILLCTYRFKMNDIIILCIYVLYYYIFMMLLSTILLLT